MTGAFTFFRSSYSKTRLTILYGAYFQPDYPAPNTTEDYYANVDYIPYMIYPYEVVNQCRK